MRPLPELTCNWPDAEGKAEKYAGGRNLGTSPTAP